MDNVDINVSYSDIHLGKKIGSGSYGVIHKAIWQTKSIAVKIIQENTSDTETEKRIKESEVLTEIRNLKQFNHRNIVTLYGVAKDPDNSICMLLEFADCGSLYNFLHCSDNDVSYVDKINWMAQCAKGMDYLHSNNTVHRDLKTQNLLLFDKYRTLKICDFGTVKQLTTINTEFIGTIRYMAPELLDADGKYTEKCDVFSFGIIFWEVMSRKKPFENLKDMHPFAIQKKIVEGVRPNVNDIMTFANSHLIKQSIEECWDQDPEMRPSMKEVICDINVNSKNDTSLCIDDIEMIEMIERGSYCDVYKVRWRTESHSKCVAAKVIQDVISNIDIEKHILDLSGHLKCLCHKNILTFYDVCKTYTNRICMLIQYADCGSLHDFLYRSKHEISYVGKLNWMMQCAKGMDYLHSKDMLHSALRTQNLLLCNKYKTLKIGDYGLIKRAALYPKLMGAIDQGEDPNALDYLGVCAMKTNVFIFGIICWQILVRKKPFDDDKITHSLAIEEIINNGDLPNIKKIDCYPDSWHIKSIIQHCWYRDPKDRPTTKTLSLLLQMDPAIFSKYPLLLHRSKALRIEIPDRETDQKNGED
ncbi:tyrosine-protein kinase JAK2-like isoform X1 [Drosophila albomicans]|uniref:Tyrosine-protein kinase JAK2-like isoform X1 n=1 Tax=Drosophila albomicans TaxID=7291 RepID=A0A6P8W9Q6_DROAB|nr:tyrosine-protein kinase JAK2-like isoform X1 [Drosophila albomicans]